MSANNNNHTTTSDDALRTAQADLASLRRVFHRLTSLSDATQFGTVLGKLLPRLVQRVGDKQEHPSSRGKRRWRLGRVGELALLPFRNSAYDACCAV